MEGTKFVKPKGSILTKSGVMLLADSWAGFAFFAFSSLLAALIVIADLIDEQTRFLKDEPEEHEDGEEWKREK
jgi:hypothetical protein